MHGICKTSKACCKGREPFGPAAGRLVAGLPAYAVLARSGRVHHQGLAEFRYIALALIGDGADTLHDIIGRKLRKAATRFREDLAYDAREFFQFIRSVARGLHVNSKPMGCRLVRTEPAS